MFRPLLHHRRRRRAFDTVKASRSRAKAPHRPIPARIEADYMELKFQRRSSFHRAIIQHETTIRCERPSFHAWPAAHQSIIAASPKQKAPTHHPHSKSARKLRETAPPHLHGAQHRDSFSRHVGRHSCPARAFLDEPTNILTASGVSWRAGLASSAATAAISSSLSVKSEYIDVSNRDCSRCRVDFK